MSRESALFEPKHPEAHRFRDVWSLLALCMCGGRQGSAALEAPGVSKTTGQDGMLTAVAVGPAVTSPADAVDEMARNLFGGCKPLQAQRTPVVGSDLPAALSALTDNHFFYPHL